MAGYINMTRVLALKLESNSALAVIVRTGGERIAVEAATRIPLVEGDDAKSRGRAIAAGLAELKPGRMPVVLVIPRSELSWQNHELPPSSADDLPDLVHMQAQRDLPLPDDGAGFDFVPLAGDEEHPYRVVAVGLLPGQWLMVRETCEAADLKLERIVPEPFGWPELGRRAVALSEATAPLTVFAAIIQRQATVWATVEQTLRLIRTVWLPEDDNAAADASALGNELRRTLLSLAQSHAELPGAVRCMYLGANADEIAGELGATLSKPVQAMPLERLVDMPATTTSAAPLVEAAPLAGLAAALAEHRPAPIDLLHPRKRPAPPSRARTYALAGVAAAALVALMAWQAYRNLQAPLEAAEAARAEQAALAPLLERFAADEVKAAAVRRWLGDSINLLTELDYLGQQLRPEPLDSDKFKADQDLVLTKLSVANREMTIDAAAKNSGAIQPAESRLRAAEYRVDRGPVEANSKAVPGYEVAVSGTIERIDPTAPAEGAAR